LPFFVERPESLVERAVVAAHKLRVVARRAETPQEGASPTLQRPYPAIQELVQALLGPPPEGGFETGGRGHVSADGPEQVTDVAVGNPVCHRNGAPGLDHPHKLTGRLLLVGGEHHAQGGEHHVEGGVLEGQVLRVALPEIHRKALRFGPPARLLQQHGNVVYSHHLAEAAGGGQGGVAVA
jgi:hypothetical protein